MNNDRGWMYQRKVKVYLNPAFVKGLENFMQHVISLPSSFNGTNIQCPYSKCRHIGGFWDAETVKLHLLKNGTYEDNLMYNMVMNVASPSFDPEIPNAETKKLYDILKSSERKLYEGYETSQLFAMAQMLSFKADHHLSEACYYQTSQFIKGILPQDNTFLIAFPTKHRKVPINDSSGGGQIFGGNISIFSHPRRSHGSFSTRYLDDREYMAAHNYILFNYPEVAPYIEIFINRLREHNPHITSVEVDQSLESDFAMWFKHYAQDPSLVPNEYI
ncbi:hypothetical protein POM88_013143 [Heracleum sosnowskyi]|uniref:Transposase-associated domain-containing protein n=1 Tax=Heracleum sosnowskyi TaxID=360622 RepID=A0AAD8IXU3_9APIA|nr:hypothetical protein POM88_013143 [Heracleum sosnowskyi]